MDSKLLFQEFSVIQDRSVQLSFYYFGSWKFFEFAKNCERLEKVVERLKVIHDMYRI